MVVAVDALAVVEVVVCMVGLVEGVVEGLVVMGNIGPVLVLSSSSGCLQPPAWQRTPLKEVPGAQAMWWAIQPPILLWHE